MHRYYFDVREGGCLIVDEEGMELPTFEAVQEEATQSLADMARSVVRRMPPGDEDREMRVEVRDEASSVLHVHLALSVNRVH
jgi:hypothetical protein